MGCLKLTYDQRKEATPFLGVWKGEDLEKLPFLKEVGLAKKEAALKKRDHYYPFGATINEPVLKSGSEKKYRLQSLLSAVKYLVMLL